jgi:integrase
LHCTVKELVNRFLSYQAERVTAKQLGARSFEDYRRVLRHFAKQIGTDLPIARVTAEALVRYRSQLVRSGLRGDRGLGVHALSRSLVLIRGCFGWGEKMGHIDRLPRWGDALDRPPTTEWRKSRANREREHGKRLFIAEQLRGLVEAADPMLRAAILLGINGGFGNTACGMLPIAALDLDNARIEFERPKTGVARTIPLWPETVAALRAVLTATALNRLKTLLAPSCF